MTTQEEKELLLRDLCARLPYGVIVDTIQGDFMLLGLTNERVFTTCEIEGCHNNFPIDCIKPYLFPLSSMTDEQKGEYNGLKDVVPNYHLEHGDTEDFIELYDNWRSIDYLNAHHFDYRGLIEEGLAINATWLNIY